MASGAGPSSALRLRSSSCSAGGSCCGTGPEKLLRATTSASSATRPLSAAAGSGPEKRFEEIRATGFADINQVQIHTHLARPVDAIRRDIPNPFQESDAFLIARGDELRQHGRLGEMIHDVPAILVALSTLFELKPGDLIFTGTPAGVAALKRGDRFHAELAGIAELNGRIV